MSSGSKANVAMKITFLNVISISSYGFYRSCACDENLDCQLGPKGMLELSDCFEDGFELEGQPVLSLSLELSLCFELDSVDR